jgi:hypothetical protein
MPLWLDGGQLAVLGAARAATHMQSNIADASTPAALLGEFEWTGMAKPSAFFTQRI